MDLWDLTRLLLRRWYFAVPLLMASVAAVVLAAQNVSPDYKSMGYMQLIPAPSSGKPVNPNAKPRPVNPWLGLGFAALGNAASLTVTNPTTLEQLAKEGYSDSITVILNDRTPLFEIEVVGDTREQAAATTQKIIKMLQDDIQAKQTQYKAMEEDTITTLVINDGGAPEQDSGTRKRVLIVAAGVGVLLTTACTIALDYWLRRRAERKAAKAAATVVGAAAASSASPASSVSPASPASPAEPEHGSKETYGEQTQVIKPPVARKNNVYSSERRPDDQRKRAPRQRASADAPLDSTVVLPSTHQSRRS
ncbi:hypothetical protein [Actinoplanes sp. G11-F43]|uniref:hypothetical protein n=1 Tax=Actinoplanes sp. G11-F43 TaxID=3424130 RepID=UPI003D325011